MQNNSSIYYDKPGENQKHPHYEHRAAKLTKKSNDFSEKKFQRVRRVSNQKKIIHSFKRIGKCLNDANSDDIPTEGLQKVCLILINNYEHDKHDPKIGPMNDGYLVGLNHHRFGFRIFYLYNCEKRKFPEFLQFFLRYTLHQLTVFYSGRDTISHASHGIEFKDGTIPCSDFGKIISENYNNRSKVVFISDSTSGGSVFGIQFFSNHSNNSNIISFSVTKCTDPDSKEGRRSHGIFTYYWCKFLYECPNITPKRLSERINQSLKRFNENMVCEYSNNELENQSLF